MLQAHTIRPAKGAKHRVKRVGRGNASGHGTYSTRGGKGQTARSGGSRGLRLLAFKRLLQSTPKLRGFTSHVARPAEVFLRDLQKHFAAGEVVNVASLKEKNIIASTARTAKVVGSGELTKKVILEGVTATKGAAEKIKAAGGEIK